MSTTKEKPAATEPARPREIEIVIRGKTPLQQSRYYEIFEGGEKVASETHDQHERRTWHMKAHTRKDGKVFMPGSAIHQCVVAASKYDGRNIPGARGKTWTAKLMSGLSVMGDLETNKTAEDMEQRMVYASSTGKSGQGGRVAKFFPTFRDWEGVARIMILDPIIQDDTLREFFEIAGKFIGIGTGRPEKRGEVGNGRFELISYKVVSWL